MAEALEVVGHEDFNEECPIKQVELTVPKTDDPNMPLLTFRMWVLGIASCVILSFVNQFFWYRTQPLSLTSISAQIVGSDWSFHGKDVAQTRRFQGYAV